MDYEDQEIVFCNHTVYIPPMDMILHIVNIYLIPTICIFGSLAALLCIVVFSKRQMRLRSSLNVYLAGLSFFDFVLLVMGLVIYTPMQTCLEQGRAGTPVCLFFWYSSPVTYPLSLIAQSCSVWTCVSVTVDRFLAVSYPLHSKIWCTPKRAFSILCTITILSILYRVPTIFELTLNDCGELMPTALRTNHLYLMLYINYGYLFAMLLVPWSVMIVLNSFVVMAVHRAYKFRQSLQSGKGQEERDRRCTMMALCMVLTFVLFNAPSALNNVVESFDIMIDMTIKRYLVSFGNLLICLNSASNIIIYSLFGARFRRMCVLMLCGRNSRWNIWLKTGNRIVSEMDMRENFTVRSSCDASVALITQTRANSARFSKPPSLPKIKTSFSSRHVQHPSAL